MFLAHPLVFLNTLGRHNVEDYLQRYRWPEVDATYPNWNASNARYYRWLRWSLSKAPAHLEQAFDLGLRNGYSNPAGRSSPMAWIQALQGTANPPEIYVFATDSDVYTEGMRARLQWWVQVAHSVTISPDIGPVAHFGEAEVPATYCRDYRLTARNLFGETEATTSVRVLRVPRMPSLSMQQYLQISTPGSVSIARPDLGGLLQRLSALTRASNRLINEIEGEIEGRIRKI